VADYLTEIAGPEITEFREWWESFGYEQEHLPKPPLRCRLGSHRYQTLHYRVSEVYWLQRLAVCTRCWRLKYIEGIGAHPDPENLPYVWDINDHVED